MSTPHPLSKGDIDTLENVQQYALYVFTKSWEMNYADLLAATSLPSCLKRQVIAYVGHLYKIVIGHTDFPDAPMQTKEFLL